MLLVVHFHRCFLRDLGMCWHWCFEFFFNLVVVVISVFSYNSVLGFNHLVLLFLIVFKLRVFLWFFFFFLNHYNLYVGLTMPRVIDFRRPLMIDVFEFYELQKLEYWIWFWKFNSPSCLLDFGDVPLDEGIEHSSVGIEEIVDSFEIITVNVSSQGSMLRR